MRDAPRTTGPNNGGMSCGGTVADVTEEDVDAVIDVHFKGAVFLTQKLLRLMADGGSIVNLRPASPASRRRRAPRTAR